LQKEFAGTIKICELGLLCAVTPKAVKALKWTLKTQATALKRKWTDFAPSGPSKKSKTVVPSSAKASGGGGSAATPPGGDGSDQNDKQIRFGNNPNQEYHTFRHIERETNLTRNQVRKAIEDDLRDKMDGLHSGEAFSEILSVEGVTIRYSSYKFSTGVINIGRITVVK
jgi:hypothetical protein